MVVWNRKDRSRYIVKEIKPFGVFNLEKMSNIKMADNAIIVMYIFKHNYAAKKVFRELSILRQLSNINFKCTLIAKLLKVVIPSREPELQDEKLSSVSYHSPKKQKS